MRRRLDLAISMVRTPRLIFLDEPTTGLDPRSREQLWGTVRHLVDQGVTVLLTTQYLDEADVLADRIVLLDHGRVVAAGTPDELKASLGGEVVRLQFADPGACRRALDLLPGARADERLAVLEVDTDGSAAQIRALLDRLDRAGAPAGRLTVHRPRLDDVFIQLTDPESPAGPAGPNEAPAKELAR
jgi:ABC-2 type transport system ATP-binding protein